jgi:hypothetical protein
VTGSNSKVKAPIRFDQLTEANVPSRQTPRNILPPKPVLHHPVVVDHAARRAHERAKADHDFATEAQELRLNTDLTRSIYALTTRIHRNIVDSSVSEREPAEAASHPPESDGASGFT